MASTRASAIFFISLLIFATTNPLANAASVNGLTLAGQLCCTSTGNCPGQGVPGATVSLNCTVLGAAVTLGQATTSANGTFNITVPGVAGLILNLPLLPCLAFVKLPLNSTVCPVLSNTTGLLESVLKSAGTVITSTLGLVQNVTLQGFINVKV